MSVNKKYLDVIPYLVTVDKNIENTMKVALQIRACKFMFQNNEPLGRKYLEYKKAKQAEGKNIDEIVKGFVDNLEGGNLQVLSDKNSLIGNKEIVLDYLRDKESIKRNGSVIADNEKKERQVDLLAIRMADTINELSFYGGRFYNGSTVKDRLDITEHLKDDETANWSKPNKIEEAMSGIAVDRYCAHTARDIANNINVSDNNVAESYKRFADKSNEEYRQLSENIGVEFEDVSPLELENDEQKEHSDHWKTFGEKYPRGVSQSKLQKLVRPYNIKALIKWLDAIIDSIDKIPINVSKSKSGGRCNY